ncbi:hypothetical protein U3516DRAFT_197582 [Neocallimastix sp. 'constans']
MINFFNVVILYINILNINIKKIFFFSIFKVNIYKKRILVYINHLYRIFVIIAILTIVF